MVAEGAYSGEIIRCITRICTSFPIRRRWQMSWRRLIICFLKNTEKHGIYAPARGSTAQGFFAVANDLGYKTVFWSFAYKDWDVNVQKGADYAFSQVTPYLHNGAILLLHAVSKDNAESLEDIINYAKESGYRFASLDELKNN